MAFVVQAIILWVWIWCWAKRVLRELNRFHQLWQICTSNMWLLTTLFQHNSTSRQLLLLHHSTKYLTLRAGFSVFILVSFSDFLSLCFDVGLFPASSRGHVIIFSISFPHYIYYISLYMSVVLLPSTVLFHGLLSIFQSLFFPCVFTSFALWIFLLCPCSCEASFPPPTQKPPCFARHHSFSFSAQQRRKIQVSYGFFIFPAPFFFSLILCPSPERLKHSCDG